MLPEELKSRIRSAWVPAPEAPHDEFEQIMLRFRRAKERPQPLLVFCCVALVLLSVAISIFLSPNVNSIVENPANKYFGETMTSYELITDVDNSLAVLDQLGGNVMR